MSTLFAGGIVRSVMKGAPFDAIAQDYDRTFTHSLLGKAHRALVHEVLQRRVLQGKRVLDLNCGTGEDAVYLASLGASVVGCDISESMIAIAAQKAAGAGYASRIAFIVCANESLGALDTDVPFDVVLSNFGGLNCTSELAEVARGLSRLVRPGGRLLLCVMGRFCAWEILWHMCHGDWHTAFRRFTRGGTEANIAGARLQVHYPSAGDLRRAFEPWFALESWRGIGVVLPPSWLAPGLEGKTRLIHLLKQVDRWFGVCPVLREVGDHTLFQLVREEK